MIIRVSWKNLARRIHAALPAGALRNVLTCRAYRWMYRHAGLWCGFDGPTFVVRTRDGTQVRSVREFDPAPLVNDFDPVPLNEGSIVLDIGANIGAVSCWLARRVGHTGRVIAFEPDPKNLEQIRQNIELNQVRNVTIVDRGAWDHEGELSFWAEGGYTSSFQRTSYVEQRPDRYQCIRVPVTTIDRVVRDLELPHVDLIKMDIEGSEVAALRGARDTLRRWRPWVIVETHVVEGRSTECGVRAELEAAGFGRVEVIPDVETSVVVAYRP